jgi:hypothetical protein
MSVLNVDVSFQFEVQNHNAFKLTHRICTTSDLDILHIHGKLRRRSFQCNKSLGQLKSKLPAIVETKSFSRTFLPMLDISYQGWTCPAKDYIVSVESGKYLIMSDMFDRTKTDDKFRQKPMMY